MKKDVEAGGESHGERRGAISRTAAVTIQELAEREEILDPVRYSPSLRRGHQIRDMVRDADRAVQIVMASLLEAETGLSACKQVYAEALMAHSNVFSVAGAHWALCTFVRGYNTVGSMAASLVSHTVNRASATALERLKARHHRQSVRKSWDDENHRLHCLDETVLRKERARQRQEYRRHKKRGRPGRVDMKEARLQLDLLQMDLDHAVGKRWHPKHAARPPSVKTPRVGPVVRKEELPPGWYRVGKGPNLAGFLSEDRPYYFHEATGLTSWINPTVHSESTKEHSGEKNRAGRAGDLLGPEGEGKIGKLSGHETDKLDVIKLDDIEEQHRKYFSEALATARRSCSLLAEIGSPRRYKGEATMALVCFAAAIVTDSEGNAATGLAHAGTDLINMAVDHMKVARDFAVKAGLKWTLDYADLCRQSANISFHRKKDGDVSDGAEFLNEAQLVYASLGLDLDDWHVIETKESQDALVLFEGYGNSYDT